LVRCSRSRSIAAWQSPRWIATRDVSRRSRSAFGDALLSGGEDPWFWASKLHFYIPEVAFHNFPYTFGHLLSRALFADQGPAFLPRYEELLRNGGRAKAHEVAKA